MEDASASPLDKQVLRGESITIEEVKGFITDCRKKKEYFLATGDRSWREIEKRSRDGRLYGGNDLDRKRRWTRFPLWWSCWQIRRSLVLARLPIPVLKDTQGDDPFGRTACILGERFTRSIFKTFDALPEFSANNDDFLITNFSWGRWFYRNEMVEEEEKLYLQIMQPEPAFDEAGQPIPAEPIVVTPDGTPVDQYLEDENGPYILTGKIVSVDNEEVYYRAGLYSALYVDPDAVRWNDVTRLAMEHQYSYREFSKKFGQKGVDTLSHSDVREHKDGKPIICYDYYDKLLKECRWLAENGADFIQPVEIAPEKREEYDNSDLYGLTDFFPCTAPLRVNASTKEFWPTPEYFQVADILDDIHSIVNRMMLLTRAIRVRFFFDSSITQLKQLIGETGEGGALGIPNLQNSLIAGKGTLANLVAYFPVNEMIEGLAQMYTAFEQRLNMFYQVTGISDLIRGQTNPDSDKTFGERQMEGKFALNRVEIFQRNMQEWLKDNYQLGMEMGLKMFSDKTIDEYIVPQTLDDEDKQRYEGALELLKSNKRRRFRVDFETDSTIAINQEWRKAHAIETANTISKMIESVAKVAETEPELAGVELKLMEHVVGELTDGKLFIDEIQDSIGSIIDKVSQPGPPEPNVDLERLKLDAQGMSADWAFKRMELQAQVQLDYAKLAQEERKNAIDSQLEQVRLGIENGASQADMLLAIQKVKSDIAQGWEDLAIRKETLLANVQQEVGKQEMERLRIILDARVKAQEITLEQAQQALDAFEVQITAQDTHLSVQERIATEKRLQAEHNTDMQLKHVEAAATMMDAMKEEPAKAAPITIDLSKTVHVKPQEKAKEKKKK